MALSHTDFEALAAYSRVLVTVLDERNPATRMHCDRVVDLCDALGRTVSLDSEDLGGLRLAALLHDIGKIGVPDSVLLKPGAFGADERRQMQTHPERGQRIILAIGLEGAEAIGLMVRHHHENFDGSGYPDHLMGENIHYVPRIIAIVDAYDAIGASRPYHSGRGHDEIMSIIDEESGRRFDPYLVGRFAKLIERSGWQMH